MQPLTGVEDVVTSGSLLVAAPVAAAAGVVSFLSPCVLPLVPAYLSYVTGLTGRDVSAPRRGRTTAGTALFVLGFSLVFVTFGALSGGIGALLQGSRPWLTTVLGGLVVLLGLTFLGGTPWPWLYRERRIGVRPRAGLAGAPLLGVAFGLGWTPCVGPTLAAVQTLAVAEGSAARGTALGVAYALGLGVPFLLVGLAVRGTAGSLVWVRRHHLAVTRLGGGLLVLLGVLLATGLWDDVTVALRLWAASVTPPL
ncbi:MAG: cytochrome c biogenesis CcdA family protein [Actinomycetes bacterium]